MRSFNRSPLLACVAAVLGLALPATATALTPALPTLGIEYVSLTPLEASTPASFTIVTDQRAALAGGTTTWDFGDGTGPVAGDDAGAAVHTFAAPGDYAITVTATAPAYGTSVTATRSFTVAPATAPTATLRAPLNESVLGLVQRNRTLAVECAGVVPAGALGVPIRSCAITARVAPDLQARLGLATDVVGTGTGYTQGSSPSVTVSVLFTPEARDAFVRLRQDVPVQLEGTVVGFVNGAASAPRAITATFSGKAGYNDCPPAKAGVVCFPWMGRQVADGAAGSVTAPGWPGITGLRWEITADADPGEKLTGTYLADALLGRHGSDALSGGEGDDVLWGDAGKGASPTGQRDSLAGGPGNDWIYASRGTNTITGGDGNDRVTALDGKGTVDCGPGADTVTLKKRKPLKQTRAQKKAHKKPKLAPDAYRVKGCEKITRR